MNDKNLFEIIQKNALLAAELSKASRLYGNIQKIKTPPNLAELQKVIIASRVLWQNNQVLYGNTMPLNETVLSMLASMQHINPAMFQQSFDYLDKNAPDISKNLNAVMNDIESQQIEDNPNAKKQYEVILLGLLTDMEALREALHGDTNDQLLSIMIFVVVSLIIYINAPSQE